MIKILISGCCGKMGQVITKLAEGFDDIKIVAGFDIYDTGKCHYPVYTEIYKCKEKVDVIIDFSNPDALESIVNYAVASNTALVVATTGMSQIHMNMLKSASNQVPVFFSANMSLGINLLINLVKKSARILEGNFDIEIIEKHHNQKIDAPSGTALAIADSLNSVLEQKKEYIYDRHSRRKKRSKNEIGIHAIRGGSIVGEHTVIFAGNDEVIELTHSATSKDIFGIGAIRAAKFIASMKPGLYGMDDLIGIS